MRNEDLIVLAVDITSAYVASNQIASERVGSLVANIHGALANLGKEQFEAEAPEPAVSIRASIKKDHLVCLACGKKMKMLKRHLSTEHGMTPKEYREAYGLPDSYSLVAPDYAKTRSDLAKKIGLGKNPNQKRGRKAAGSK
ncbi:MucR family transcriptional regulator [Qipengyuania aquimaris]|uniref:MucR family transcriptional regulator n=1 Tax=Qipengyuania aquimaris TaxID=255984 RepID=UPI001F3BC6CD|nr:MucR family transcriptional regulator [Qipengyuania aquimaris]